MTERRIVGVDFSGGGEDNQVGNTWVTEGYLDGSTTLTISDCRPISRNDLRELLQDLPPSAVAAMDFPFGVPKSFAENEFDADGSLMPDMWDKLSTKVKNDPGYITKTGERLGKNGNLRQFNKVLREWDRKHFPSRAFSPLNPASPQMFRMTFHGMKMLNELWRKTKCSVPPLDCPDRTGPELLETMPGAALEAVGLPSTNYKNNKGRNALANLRNRKEIIDGLPGKFGIEMPNLRDGCYDLCIFNDDALDSIVAAVVAALWANDKDKARTLFHRPEDHKDTVLAAAKREGCIYVPKPTK